jgi:hypothetical protein
MTDQFDPDLLVDYGEDVTIREKKQDDNNNIEIKGYEIKKTKFEETYGFSPINKSFDEIKNTFKNTLDKNLCGEYNFKSNGDCANIKENNKSKIKLENIIAKFEDIYKDKKLAENSIIQVETLVNSTIYDNLELYFEDKKNSYLTLASSGLAFRHYLIDNINMLYDFFAFLKNKDNSINFKFENNNLLVNSESDIRKMNQILGSSMDYRRHARTTIISCFQKNQKVEYGNNSDYLISNVFCPSIMLSHNPALWKGIIELILEAYYENTLAIAHQINKKNKTNNTCYLVSIGETNNYDKKQITRAIQRACHIGSLRGYDLNVKIVHQNNISDEFKELPTSYPLGYVNVNSMWESNWLNNAK